MNKNKKGEEADHQEQAAEEFDRTRDIGDVKGTFAGGAAGEAEDLLRAVPEKKKTGHDAEEGIRLRGVL